MTGSTDSSAVMDTDGRCTVAFPLAKVYEEVHVQSWYQGEVLKRKDADTAIMQSSEDDTVQMQNVCAAALNDIVLKLSKRLRDIDWSIGEEVRVVFTPFRRMPEGDAARVVHIMGKAMMDYMANECMVSWFETTAAQHPEIAETYRQKSSTLMGKILDSVSMLSEHPVRRRATNLCGI